MGYGHGGLSLMLLLPFGAARSRAGRLLRPQQAQGTSGEEASWGPSAFIY